MSDPIPLGQIDVELCAAVESGDVLLADEVETQLALELAREYAKFLMGWRKKSPAGDGLSIMQNQYVRSETWRIVRRHGMIRRELVTWERHLRERGVLAF